MKTKYVIIMVILIVVILIFLNDKLIIKEKFSETQLTKPSWLKEFCTKDLSKIERERIAQSIFECENNTFIVSEIAYAPESSSFFIDSQANVLYSSGGLFPLIIHNSEKYEKLKNVSCKEENLCKQFILDCTNLAGKRFDKRDCEYLNSLRK